MHVYSNCEYKALLAYSHNDYKVMLAYSNCEYKAMLVYSYSKALLACLHGEVKRC